MMRCGSVLRVMLTYVGDNATEIMGWKGLTKRIDVTVAVLWTDLGAYVILIASLPKELSIGVTIM